MIVSRASWFAGGRHATPTCTIALVSLVALVAACSPSRPASASRTDDAATPVRGGTLRLVGPADVGHLSTTSAYSTAEAMLLEAIARQLVSYRAAADYETATSLAADLARELPTQTNGGISADGRVYRFHLRRGVRWNTVPPRAVTAHDFVRAFKLFCNPVHPVGNPGYYTRTITGMADYCSTFAREQGTVASIRQFISSHDIEGVHAEDDLTLQFRLVAPTADFLNLLAFNFGAPVPDEYLDYLPDSPEFRQHTLSNGPYAITHYVQDRSYELERNPVWDPATDPLRPAYVDRIRITLGIDEALAQLQLEAGTADLGFDVDARAADVATLRRAGDSRLWLQPEGDHYLGYLYMAVNQLGPNNGGALKLLKVRQALALAVDKMALAQLSGGLGVGRPLRQAVPSSMSGFRPGSDRYVTPGDRGDPVAARRLLGETGLTGALRLQLVHSSRMPFPTMAQSIQENLRRAGIEVHLSPWPPSGFYASVLTPVKNARRGAWDLALGEFNADWFGSNSGRAMIATLFDGRMRGYESKNYGGYSNPVVNAAIDLALVAPSAALADDTWVEAAAQVMADVGRVPLIEKKSARMLSSRVRNCLWYLESMQCYLTSVWLADAAATQPARPP